MRAKILRWFQNNVVAVILSVLFVIVHVIKAFYPQTNEILGSCSLKWMNGQFYRWFTDGFLHYGLYHLCGNIFGLLVVGSLITPFIGKWKTLLVYFMGGALAGAAFSWLVNSDAPNYGGGASGCIFALIACLGVCYLRFPEEFKMKWYRFDVLAVIVYFVIANDNWSSFLTHSLGFVSGTVISFLLVVFRVIRPQKINAEKSAV